MIEDIVSEAIRIEQQVSKLVDQFWYEQIQSGYSEDKPAFRSLMLRARSKITKDGKNLSLTVEWSQQTVRSGKHQFLHIRKTDGHYDLRTLRSKAGSEAEWQRVQRYEKALRHLRDQWTDLQKMRMHYQRIQKSRKQFDATNLVSG